LGTLSPPVRYYAEFPEKGEVIIDVDFKRRRPGLHKEKGRNRNSKTRGRKRNTKIRGRKRNSKKPGIFYSKR